MGMTTWQIERQDSNGNWVRDEDFNPFSWDRASRRELLKALRMQQPKVLRRFVEIKES